MLGFAKLERGGVIDEFICRAIFSNLSYDSK